MTDVFLEIGKNPQARSLIKALGLPLPMPTPLKRPKGPWQALPLQEQHIVTSGGAGSHYAGMIAETLARAGATPYLADPILEDAFHGPGEAYGHLAHPAADLDEGQKLHAILLDASGLRGASALRKLYDAYHPWLRKLRTHGRVVVIGDLVEEAEDSAAAMAQAALEGFVRSLAKEIGRKGATANLLRIGKGAASRAQPVLRFLLSSHAAFLTAQPFVVTRDAEGEDGPWRWEHALDQKVVLLTGAARGIGKATAQLMAREGAHVVCLDRPEEDSALSQLAREIKGTPLAVDLTHPEANHQILNALTKRGGVDVIVHNAGVTRDKTLARMKPEFWDLVLQVNLDAIAALHDTLKDTVLRDNGRVVCLSSVAGIAGNMGQTAYAASKAGVMGFVQHTAQQLKHRGITVNAVAPGFIETRMTAAIPFAIREAGRRLSALGQGGLPEDVGQLITFLASANAQGITGRTIRACGGALIGA